MNPLIQSKNATILPVLIALTLGCFGLSPQARAVCQDGCDLGLGNTFLGDNALINNTSGFYNTAIGASALPNNTTGYENTANGVAALLFNTTGFYNTANGAFALYLNTTGSNNTASGFEALFSNTTGSNNLANGFQALFNNTTGFNNMATGSLALLNNTTGFYNMANGSNSMVFNTTGSFNVAEGLNALRFNTTGNSNTAVGLSALLNNTTGGGNIALGSSAGSSRTTGSNNIDIGNLGVAGESNAIRIGKASHQATYIAGIRGKVVAGGVGVIVGADGHLGTMVSSQHFKTAIKPMEEASEAILALKPVTFRYKPELDPEGIPQFGLVAEDVEKVNPDLVARDDRGKVYTVRYEAVNAMLLNEFLKEHRKGQEQAATISQLKAELAQQQKEIKALSAQIQKVSAQIELSKPAPQTVLNNQ
jgi:Chaperone of endosialidase